MFVDLDNVEVSQLEKRWFESQKQKCLRTSNVRYWGRNSSEGRGLENIEFDASSHD